MINRLRFDKYSALYLWALFMIVFGITEGDHVPQLDLVQAGVDRTAVFTGSLALAFLVPLATGTFDLAIGANMSMALVISATLSSNGTMPDFAAMFIALVACAVAGFVSGFFVVRLKVNSFIATSA